MIEEENIDDNKSINPNNLIQQIKSFDKSKLNKINDSHELNNEENKTIKYDVGKREKKLKNIAEQLNELDKMIEDMFPTYKQPLIKKNDYNDEQETIKSINIKKYNCELCDFKTNKSDDFKEHIDKHTNETENKICICNRCGEIFEDDDSYDEHKNKCKLKKSNKLKKNKEDGEESYTFFQKNASSSGKYECPVCSLKFTNAFILGEHFILDHNDYDTLRQLDIKNCNGFPGFEILEKIDMLQISENEINKETATETCDICCFQYDNNLNINISNLVLDNTNRVPIEMKCCHMLICCDCIMNNIIETDSIICPFCKKDHNKTDQDYIIFVEETDETNRDIWEAWWINHLEIFD